MPTNAEPDSADSAEHQPRQRVEKTGPRRARLTPVEGTDTAPESPIEQPDEPTPADAREAEMLRDRPPHWS